MVGVQNLHSLGTQNTKTIGSSFQHLITPTFPSPFFLESDYAFLASRLALFGQAASYFAPTLSGFRKRVKCSLDDPPTRNPCLRPGKPWLSSYNYDYYC